MGYLSFSFLDVKYFSRRDVSEASPEDFILRSFFALARSLAASFPFFLSPLLVKFFSFLFPSSDFSFPLVFVRTASSSALSTFSKDVDVLTSTSISSSFPLFSSFFPSGALRRFKSPFLPQLSFFGFRSFSVLLLVFGKSLLLLSLSRSDVNEIELLVRLSLFAELVGVSRVFCPRSLGALRLLTDFEFSGKPLRGL